MRRHLVSAPGIAVRRGQSALLMPNELLVRVARTDYVDASLRGCSEHEFPWRARAQPKLRSEFIPSTSAPATETQPSRNSTSPNSCSSLSEKCPTTDQWASHGKLTNHGAQQGEIVRRDKSIALKDDSQRYQDKTGLLQPVVTDSITSGWARI